MDAPTARHLALLLGLAAAVHGVLLAHAEVAARDSIGFIRFALQLEGTVPVYRPVPERLSAVRPWLPEAPRRWLDAVATSEQPPGYPLAVWAASVPVRRLYDGPLADAMSFSARLASAAAGVLLVVPVYFLGRRLFHATGGLAAAALFQCLPVAAQVTTDGLSEATFLLAFAGTLWLGVEAVRRPTFPRCLACGLGAAAAYLTRPEGALLALAAGAVLAGLVVVRHAGAARGLAGLAAGFALLAGPYMLAIGGFTNKPTGQGLLDPSRAISTAGPRGPAGGPPLAVYVNEQGKARPAHRGLWAARAVATEWLKSSHYLVGLLGLAGAWLVRHRLRWSAGLWLVAALAGLNAGLLWYLALRAGYVSERHLVPLALVACLFAGAALPWLGRRLAALRPALPGPAWAGVALFALLAGGVPVAAKTLHANRAGFRAAGEWLAARVEPVDSVFDPYCWAHYYSGAVFREGRPPTPPVPPRPPFAYFVLERSDNAHPRLPSLPWVEREAARGEEVFCWQDPAEPRRRVVVCRLRLGPPSR